jgi:4-hydroxy-3-methylbut-2-en-1-yl diphosphate synthase IspG/GcpE
VFLAVAAYEQFEGLLRVTSRHYRGRRVAQRHRQILDRARHADTIRVSLSADPVEEVKVGFEMLKALNLRRRGITVISCPSCARQQFEVIKTVEQLEERLAHITTPLTLSVIG